MEKISDLHKTAKTQLFEAVNHYNFNQFLSQTVSINTKEIIANISDLLSSNSDQVWLDSLQSLLSLKSLISSLQLFHELIDSGEVLEASDLIVDILNNIQILEKLSKKDCNHCPEFIIDILYQQYLDRLSTLKYFLNDVFSMAFVFHSRSEFTSLTVSSRVMNTCTGKNAPNKKFLLSPISIESLYSSMEKIGILEARMFRFCESLISLFLKPILANTQLLLFSEKKATSNCLKYRKDVRKSNSETQSSLDSIKSLLTFGQFIKSTVFANINLSGTSMALKYFYKSFHKTLVTELSTSVIAASLPTENGKLEIFIDLARSILKPFETEWIELSLIPQFNTDIDDLISHIPFIYAIERRNSLLQVARDIILSDDWNTVTVEEATEQGGLSLLFGNQKGFNSEKSAKEGLVSVDSSASDLKLQKCQVSVQAQTIIETVYQTLSEAKNSTVEGYLLVI